MNKQRLFPAPAAARPLLMALLALLLAALGAGCENEPPKPVRLVIKTPVQEMNCVSNPNIRDTTAFLKQASAAFAAQYRKAPVLPEVMTFNRVDEVKAVPGSFGTETAPDILFGAFFNLMGYADMGRVVPLDDFVTPLLGPDLDPPSLEVGTREGRVYLLPFLNVQNILIYNKELFRRCGLERFIGHGREIQDWTLPEWRDILDTLAARLPHGIYPLAIFAGSNEGDTHILTYLRAFGGKIFDSEGRFDFQDPATVKALAWLQEGVRRGWFPPHPENLELKDCSELFANGQLAISMFSNSNSVLAGRLDDYGFVNFPGNVATTFYRGFAVFDNGDPARVQPAKDFLAYLYAHDEWRDLSAGNIPVSRRTLRKYRDRIPMIDEFERNAVNVVNFTNKSPNWQGREDSFRSVFWPNINKLLALKITPEQCAAALDRACNAALEQGRKLQKLHP
ncbi:MAG: extracellular solute-binding protein [Desulfovibrio sp.]|nr:extracellular solute-binding protein [Desulfovibrio sp.]